MASEPARVRERIFPFPRDVIFRVARLRPAPLSGMLVGARGLDRVSGDRLSTPVEPSEEFKAAVRRYLSSVAQVPDEVKSATGPSMLGTALVASKPAEEMFGSLYQAMTEEEHSLSLGMLRPYLVTPADELDNALDCCKSNVRKVVEGRWLETLVEGSLGDVDSSEDVDLSALITNALEVSFDALKASVEYVREMILGEPRFERALNLAAAGRALMAGDIDKATDLLGGVGGNLKEAHGTDETIVPCGFNVWFAGLDLLKFSLLCHVMASRGVSADELMKVREAKGVVDGFKALSEYLEAKDLAEACVYGIKEGLENIIREYESQLFASTDVMPSEDDLRRVFDAAIEYVTSLHSLIEDLSEGIEDAVENWVSVGEKIRVGDATFSPEEYDQKWAKAQKSSDALSRVAEEALARVGEGREESKHGEKSTSGDDSLTNLVRSVVESLLGDDDRRKRR